MWLLQVTFVTLLTIALAMKVLKFIVATQFLSSFPHADYTHEALGKEPNRLLWLKRLIFGHLIDFGLGSGNTIEC